MPGFLFLKTDLVYEEKKFLANYGFNDGCAAWGIRNAIVLHTGIV